MTAPPAPTNLRIVNYTGQVSGIPAYAWKKYNGPAYPDGIGAHSKHVHSSVDTRRGKVLFYGGDYPVNDGGPGYDADNAHENMWEVDLGYGDTAPIWTKFLTNAEGRTAGFPEGRCAPCLTYDYKRERHWMHNGMPVGAPGAKTGLVRGGIWTINPTEPVASQRIKLEGPGIPDAWSTGGAQIPRYTGDRVYFGRLLGETIYAALMYGAGYPYLCKYDLRGIAIGGADPNKDHWSTGSLMPSPSLYLGVTAFCVDTRRGHLIFYCVSRGPTSTDPGLFTAETWELCPPSTWTLLSSDMLPMKDSFGLSFDSVNDMVACFGGGNTHDGSDRYLKLNDFWLLPRDPAHASFHAWFRPTVTGDIPTPRLGEALGYDEKHNKHFVISGTSWADWNQTVTTGLPDYPGGCLGHEIFTISLGRQYEHTELAAIPGGYAKDLGAYPLNTVVNGISENEITAYSGMVCDDDDHRLVLTGGGHSATEANYAVSMDHRPGAPLVWQADHPRTPHSMMIPSNVGSWGQWISGGGAPVPDNLQISKHTYAMNVYMRNTRMFYSLARPVNGGENLGWNPGASIVPDTTIRIPSYNPRTKLWTWTGRDNTPWGYAAACPDPVGGKIVIAGSAKLGGLGRIWVWDPQDTNNSTNLVVGPYLGIGGGDDEENVVHCPDDDRFYYFRGKWNTGLVYTFSLDRTNPAATPAPMQVAGITGTPPPQEGAPNGNRNFVWDKKNKLFLGGICQINGVDYIHAFDPVLKTWTRREILTMPGAAGKVGYQAFYCLAYSEDHELVFFITRETPLNPGSGVWASRHTYAYRWA